MIKLYLTILVVFALTLAGCASAEDSTGTAANNTETTGSGPAAPAESNTVAVNIPAPDETNANVKPIAIDPSKAGKPAPMTRPAPEDSEFTATLTDVAKETRTFRNHPQIRRVEKVSDGKRSTVKVYLVNGKVAEFDGAKLPSLIQASTHQILELAGVEPVQRGIVDKPDSEKKDRN